MYRALRTSIMLPFLFAFLVTGCATSFSGSAHINLDQCQAKCSKWNMIVTGMVAMGEYSTACVCQPPTGPKTSSPAASVSGVTGASAGVMMQMQRMRRQQQ